MIAEPVDAEVEAVRIAYRRALAEELQTRIAAAMQAGHLPAQDTRLAAPALVGALLEGLIGPLAPGGNDDPARTRDAVQTLTLLSLRALGVVDARARGLVVQIALPALEEGERRNSVAIVMQRRLGQPVGDLPQRVFGIVGELVVDADLPVGRGAVFDDARGNAAPRRDSRAPRRRACTSEIATSSISATVTGPSPSMRAKVPCTP